MTNKKDRWDVLGAVVRGWGYVINRNKVVDDNLVFAITEEIMPLIAEATRKGEVKALTALAQKVSAMTMKDPGGLSEASTHEDYFDNGYTCGVNVACMEALKLIESTKLNSLT